MGEKDKTSEENAKQPFMCEVCRCKVTRAEADKKGYFHCGRKMTPMEVIYMSDPSPSGP